MKKTETKNNGSLENETKDETKASKPLAKLDKKDLQKIIKVAEGILDATDRCPRDLKEKLVQLGLDSKYVAEQIEVLNGVCGRILEMQHVNNEVLLKIVAIIEPIRGQGIAPRKTDSPAVRKPHPIRSSADILNGLDPEIAKKLEVVTIEGFLHVQRVNKRSLPSDIFSRVSEFLKPKGFKYNKWDAFQQTGGDWSEQ